MRRLLPCLALLVACCLAACAPAPLEAQKAATELVADASHRPRIARIEASVPSTVKQGETATTQTLQHWMAEYKIPAVSIVVFQNYQVVWAKAYGVTEAGGSSPTTIETLFQAASISKPVAAMAALRYVEAGRWSLDEDINAKLISWKVPPSEFTKTEKVTLRRLLSHSAGTTVHGFPGYAAGTTVPTAVQVLSGEGNTKPVIVDLVPGAQMRYSGGGTTIVQQMMIDQLKKPFPEIMQEAVIGPLGLTHSTYVQPLPADRVAMAASGSRRDGSVVTGKWHTYPEIAAAGLWTTPSDLALIAIEVAKAKAGTSSRVLSQAMTQQMLSKQSEGFGLGFALVPGTDQFGHNGANMGFQATLAAFYESGNGLAIMANSDSGFRLLQPLTRAIMTEYGWKWQ